MRAEQKGSGSCLEKSGWSLKRTARKLFSAKHSSISLESFSSKAPKKTQWNWYQISGFIGGSELEFLRSFSFLRHQIKICHLLDPFTPLMDIAVSSKIRQTTRPWKSAPSVKYGPDRSLSVRKSWNDRWESFTLLMLVPLDSLSLTSSKTGSVWISMTDRSARSTKCTFVSPNPVTVAIMAGELTSRASSTRITP